MAFNRHNIVESHNVSGDVQFLRLRDDGVATCTTIDRNVFPPLVECWHSQVGVRRDVIVWQPLTGCGGGGGGGGLQSINGSTLPNQTIVGVNGLTVSTVNGVTTITPPPAPPALAANLPIANGGWIALSDDEWYQDFNHNLNKTPVNWQMFDVNGAPVHEVKHQLLSPNTLRLTILRDPDTRFNGNVYVT